MNEVWCPSRDSGQKQKETRLQHTTKVLNQETTYPQQMIKVQPEDTAKKKNHKHIYNIAQDEIEGGGLS